MQPVLSRSQIQELDRQLVGLANMPGLVLMENAGRGATQEIVRRWPQAARATLVVCGTGNNGGDGFVVARQLAAVGCAVRVVAIGRPEKITSDAASMMHGWIGVGGQVEWIDHATGLQPLHDALDTSRLVVDALFGTGLSKPLTGVHADVVGVINQRGLPCCALDIPSGLDCDTGVPLGCVVRADLTVAFGYPKIGQFSVPASLCVGELVTVSLGVPAGLWQRVGKCADRFDVHDWAAWLTKRPPSLHKGQAGRVAIVAGSPGTVGAALLAARGTLRAGAGLVTHLGFASAMDAIESRVLEAMTCRLDLDTLEGDAASVLSGFDSIVLGPGLGLSDEANHLVRVILRTATVPVVVDADAITLVSRSPGWLSSCPGPRVLTPHAAELARLLDTNSSAIENDRFTAVNEAVSRFNAVVVLKGPYTLVSAPDKMSIIVGDPNPVLATGGTGDVLAGMLGAALLTLPPPQAAVVAAGWHGLAARHWVARHHADRGLLAHELADCLPSVFAELATYCAPLSL